MTWRDRGRRVCEHFATCCVCYWSSVDVERIHAAADRVVAPAAWQLWGSTCCLALLASGRTSLCWARPFPLGRFHVDSNRTQRVDTPSPWRTDANSMFRRNRQTLPRSAKLRQWIFFRISLSSPCAVEKHCWVQPARVWAVDPPKHLAWSGNRVVCCGCNQLVLLCPSQDLRTTLR